MPSRVRRQVVGGEAADVEIGEDLELDDVEADDQQDMAAGMRSSAMDSGAICSTMCTHNTT